MAEGRPTIPFTLDDGTPILLRPITPEDRLLFERGFERLSGTSRFLRFFAPVEHLTPEHLDYLTHVDQTNHVAWGAVDPEAPDLLGLGVARFVRLKEEPSVAEVAVTVIDAYQHRGLGTVLFGLLYLRALALGLTELRAFLTHQNQIFAERLHDLGSTVEATDGMFVVHLPVHPPERLPDTEAGRAFKDLLLRLRAVLPEECV